MSNHVDHDGTKHPLVRQDNIIKMVIQLKILKENIKKFRF